MGSIVPRLVTNNIVGAGMFGSETGSNNLFSYAELTSAMEDRLTSL